LLALILIYCRCRLLHYTSHCTDPEIIFICFS